MSLPDLPRLEGVKVTLRSPEERDIEERMRITGHPDYVYFVGGGRKAARVAPDRDRQAGSSARASSAKGR